MSNFVNYTQLLLDLKTAIDGANLGFKRVFKNADDGNFTYDNMPLLDLRLRRSQPDLVSIPNGYYVNVVVEAEIAVFDMTSRDKCATIRDNLTNLLQQFLQRNPRFAGVVDSTIVGDVDFAIGETKQQGEFVAAAIATFNVKVYSE